MNVVNSKERSPKEMAIEIMKGDTPERKEAEKMMGHSVFEMTKRELWLAAVCLSAFSRE